MHMPSLNLTRKLSFELSFRMFIIKGYYTEKQTFVVLGLLVVTKKVQALTSVGKKVSKQENSEFKYLDKFVMHVSVKCST